MPRGLDHIVHAVRDLDAAGDLYRRIGFTVGARNRHSWGTHNHLVQLPGFFIELLAVAEPEKLRGEGLRGAVRRFQSPVSRAARGPLVHDAGKPRRAGGCGAIPRQRTSRARMRCTFERAGKGPDGSTVTGRLLARVRARPARTRDRFCGLPAAQSAEFLESRAPAACQWGNRHRRRSAGRREPDRPSHLPHRLQRRARAACRLGRAHCADTARRHPDHGPGRLPHAFRGRAARPIRRARGLPRCASRCASARRCTHALTSGDIAFSEHMGQTVIAPAGCYGRNACIRDVRESRRLTDGACRRHGRLARGEMTKVEPAPNPIVAVGAARFGNALPLALIAGPCALESRAHALEMAGALKEIAARLKLGFVYKTSFDKANRTSARATRGIGLKEALPIFAELRSSLGRAGAHRRARRGAVRARRRSGRRAADPGFPLPADRSSRRRSRDRAGGQRQEGPVPGALGHGATWSPR